MPTNETEIEREQAYFDTAAEERERRRAKAIDPNAAQVGIHPGAAAAIREANKLRANEMGSPDTPVAFWRYDSTDDGTYYIGRTPIFDRAYNPLVISWKAEAAAKFVQSTRQNSLGVERKRYFTTERNTITDIADEWLTEDRPALPSSVMQDPILRSLEERRSGRLRDIVATIEKAQDEVMRAPSDGLIVVQGGPGTGKTVVGLQRISLIAYREMLESKDLLFVGPTRSFINYVGQVLPTLGDEGVRHLSVSSLGPISPRRIHSESKAMAARVKGDARMAVLLERALQDRKSVPDDEIEFEVDGRRVAISPEDVRGVLASIESGNQPHNLARNALRERLLQVVVTKANDYSRRTSRPEISDFEVRGNREFNNLLDRVWPTYSPQEFLRDLLGSERRLAAHSSDLFTEDEILAIARPSQARLSDEPWTSADLALMDEVEVLLNGLQGIENYQHIVVDEAQDLSPMQLRAIQRRRSKGMTVLGDLAQAVGPWKHRSWDQVTSELGGSTHAEVVELTIGYRVPSEVMAVASRVADSLDLPVQIPEPIRDFGEPPNFVRANGEPAARTAVAAVREQLAKGRSVGLITSETSRSEIAAVLNYEGLEWGDGEETTLKPVTLITAAASKGLEFDAVVILEPIDICDASDTGLEELFVSLTRTTGALTIAYARQLPEQLREFGEDPTEPSGNLGSDVEKSEWEPPERSREMAGRSDAEIDSPVLVEAPLDEDFMGPLSEDLAKATIKSLAERVAFAVNEVIQPSAFGAFVEQLKDELESLEPEKRGDRK